MWRPFLILLFAMLASPAGAAPRIPTGSIGTTLASDSAERWVSFTLTPGNQIRFEASIDGTPVTAILDTGVSVSVVSNRLANRAGLRSVSASHAEAIGGIVPIRFAAARAIEVGGLTREGGRIGVLAVSALATGEAEPVDALIGSDILSCCALDIDYDRHRFRLLPSGSRPFAGTSVSLTLASDTHVYLSRLSLGSAKRVRVIVDTGDGASITVARNVWKAARARDDGMTSAIAYGLGGPIETGLTVVPQARLDSLVARNVEVRIEGGNGFSNLTGTGGRIGSAFLQHYRVLLDPLAGRIVFAPGRTVDTPPVRSTSGLLVGFDRDRLRVLHVMKNSPAASAGWRDGDMICRIDGAPVAQPSNDKVDVSWSAGPPGDVVHLGMCDGSRRSLTLAQFY